MDYRGPEDTIPFQLESQEANDTPQPAANVDVQDEPDDGLTQSELDKLSVERVYDLKSYAESYRASYYDVVWRLCKESYSGYKQYRSGMYNVENEKDKEKLRANIRIWNTFVQVESSVAKMVPSILADPSQIIQVFPKVYSESGRSRADAVVEMLRYQFEQQMDAASILNSVIKRGDMLGLSAMKLYYKYNVRDKVLRRPVYDESGKCIGIVRKKWRGVVDDRPDISVPDTSDLWWNPSATEFDDSVRWVIERSWYTREELKMLGEEGIFRNVDELLDKVAYSTLTTTDKFIRTGMTDVSSSEDPLIEIYELTTPERIITVSLESSICLRDAESPFDEQIIPYFWYRSTPCPGEHVGYGQIEPVIELDDESNAKRNQRLDNINRMLNMNFLAGSRAGLRTKSLELTPFAIHQCSDERAIVPFPFQNVTQDAMVEDERCKNDMDRTNGNFDIGRGEAPGGGQATATEIQTRMSQMAGRTQLRLMLFNRSLGKMWKSMWGLNQQFGCTSAFILLAGPNGQKLQVDPMELYGHEYEFVFGSGSFIGNASFERAQLNQFLQQILPTPLGAVLDQRKLWKRISKAWSNTIPGIEDCVLPEFLGNAPPGKIYKDPVAENMQMLQTMQALPVLDGEEHDIHIPIHMRDLMSPTSPASIQQVGAEHVNAHYQKLAAEAQQMAAQQQQQPQPQMSGRPPMPSGLPMDRMGMTQDMANVGTSGGMMGNGR